MNETNANAALDVLAYRADTPAACRGIHLNAASAGLPPRIVTDAVVAQLEAACAHGPHAAMTRAAGAIDRTRADAAAFLGCDGAQIAFGETCGRLWATAFSALKLRKGAQIIVSRGEWGGNVLNCMRRRDIDGCEILIAERDRNGVLNVEHVRHLLSERTAAICMPLVESGAGAWQPVEAVGALPRPSHCLLFVDGAQAVGRRRVDLTGLQADILVAPARKWLRGPRGQAVMALSRRALEELADPAIIDQDAAVACGPEGFRLRADAARFESYEFSWAGRAGFGAAIRYVMACGIDAIGAVIDARVQQLYRGLSALGDVQLPPGASECPAFLTFALPAMEAHALVARLGDLGITVTAIDRRTTWFDHTSRQSPTIRVSPHAYTSGADIDRFLETLDRWRHGA